MALVMTKGTVTWVITPTRVTILKALREIEKERRERLKL